MFIGDYPLYFKRLNYENKDDVDFNEEPFSYSCLIVLKTSISDDDEAPEVAEFGRAFCNDICCSDCILQPSCKTAKHGQAKAIIDYVKYNYPDQFI